MKRKLIYASALVTCLAASAAFAGGPEILVEPDYFSGFFVGATGAFHMAAFPGATTASSLLPLTGTSSVTANVVPPGLGASFPVTINQIFFPAGTWLTNDTNGDAFNGYYGVQGGVGKVFNHRWYIGVVGFGEWGDQSDTVNNTAQFSVANATSTTSTPNNNFVPQTTVNGIYSSSTTVKISNDYGVAFKPGFLVAPKTMFYGKVGAAWANLKVSNSFVGVGQESTTGVSQILDQPIAVSYAASGVVAGSSSNTDNKVGLLLGLGAEQFIYKNFVTINVEYNYVNYGNVSTTTPLVGQGQTNTVVQAGPGGSVIATAGSITSLTGATVQSSANAKVSTLLAGLNFYFGSQWF